MTTMRHKMLFSRLRLLHNSRMPSHHRRRNVIGPIGGAGAGARKPGFEWKT